MCASVCVCLPEITKNTQIRITTHNLPSIPTYLYEKNKKQTKCACGYFIFVAIDSCVEIFMECFGLGWLISFRDFHGIQTISIFNWTNVTAYAHAHIYVCVPVKKLNNKNSRVEKRMLYLFFDCGCVLSLICCWFFSPTPENHSIQHKFTVWMLNVFVFKSKKFWCIQTNPGDRVDVITFSIFHLMSHKIGMEKLQFVNFILLLNCKEKWGKKWQKVKEGHANIQIANLQLRVSRHYHAG